MKIWEGINMRRVVGLALLALALPIAAWADSINITNQNGSVTISNMAGTGGAGTVGASTISTKGSQLTQYNGYSAAPGHSLGTVSFTTGALLTGTVSGGGTFAAGGSFDVIGVGAWAKALTGQNKNPITLFSGSFSGPVTWTLTSSQGVHLTYTLSGDITGTLYNGRMVSGQTTQTLYSTKGQLSAGIGHISMGTTGLATPEPGTLGLLGTGLVAIAGMFRRKLMS
jgi:hypothetical protein